MEINVKRVFTCKDYTIGRLYIDGEYFCDTLEDCDRGLDQGMTDEEIRRLKIYGKTAIPTGTYRVVLTYSNRFRKVLPEILSVKGYSGVRIHTGNVPEDTLGCILVGRNTKKGMVTESRKMFAPLLDMMRKAKDITLTIKRGV